MTLSLKDINSAATGSFTYNHFSRISILQDTFTVEEQKRQKLFLKQKINKVYDISRRCYHEHSGRDWDAAVVSEENNVVAHLLSTESDSVLDFSILSERADIDSDLQLFTPNVLGGNSSFDLAELNAQMALLLVEYFPGAHPSANFLTRLTLAIVPQMVRLNQALDRYDHLGSAEQSVGNFLHTCDKLFPKIWIPHLSEAIENMKSGQQILQKFDGRYSKVEAKDAFEPGVRRIIRKWSLLNYFPVVLIKSLNFQIESNSENRIAANDVYFIGCSELFKIAFITLAIEVSKGLEKVINILIELNASNGLTNKTLIILLELLLECTVDSRAAEIMIGLDRVVKRWILFKEAADESTRSIFQHWAGQILESYNAQKELEHKLRTDEEEDEADLMFDKWEVGKMFVNEIIQFIEPRNSTRARSDLFGWLTVFDECHHSSSSQNYSQDPQFDFDTVSIRSIQLPPTSEVPKHAYGKREALRRWAMSKKNKMSEGYRRIKKRFQQAFHTHTTRALITSVRYYNAINGRKYEYHFPDETTEFTPDQCAQVQRITQKLYKREKRGKRKRDAIKVIFM
ncbi:hypothetical protein HG536_0F02940 [Torulaspora globosa]|uniref:Uncharacterized protein n=1 Tax=Torulaspora globosa TaxID=48254 RepID=A0A7G3ZKD3_9SACH|nr:uncharacterized protein HG536_0F02940 [Torulaspora globosa]QLL33969.1 hypothetical protein HG536_0F02940 [Torulaspora globosa]